jgi:predicted Zn-dependent peptidase
MPDKSNVDVRLGHPVPIRRDHPDYHALYVGNYILGGNFAARLMNTVRDEKGLTYHIGSGLSGVTTRYAGYWQTSVTLSQDALEEGLAATTDVIRRFVEEGATEAELDDKKTTITGSYAVGLATTRRLAQSILTNAERGFDTGYLDRFPEEIRALTLEEVNAAVRTHLRPDELHEALAGVPTEAPAAE